MNPKTALLSAALGSLLLASVQAVAEDAKTEQCYGVAKAGKNDCATNAHGCATEAKKDRDPKEWISLPKGSCEKIAGGSLKPGK